MALTEIEIQKINQLYTTIDIKDSDIEKLKAVNDTLTEKGKYYENLITKLKATINERQSEIVQLKEQIKDTNHAGLRETQVAIEKMQQDISTIVKNTTPKKSYSKK
jgi:SMC interacting uncharacterized protein involved in chromosome segregation